MAINCGHWLKPKGPCCRRQSWHCHVNEAASCILKLDGPTATDWLFDQIWRGVIAGCNVWRVRGRSWRSVSALWCCLLKQQQIGSGRAGRSHAPVWDVPSIQSRKWETEGLWLLWRDDSESVCGVFVCVFKRDDYEKGLGISIHETFKFFHVVE